MLAFTLLGTVLAFFATVIAAGRVEESSLFSRQISPQWVPEKCKDQWPIATEIANSQCPTYECMCTERFNTALTTCLGCTIQSEKDNDPNFTHQLEMAYEIYINGCKNHGLTVPELSLTSSSTGSPSSPGGGSTTAGSTSPSPSGGSGGSGSGGGSSNGASSSNIASFWLAGAMIFIPLFLF